jgi:DmsE family decaheme c-type cytochrome
MEQSVVKVIALGLCALVAFASQSVNSADREQPAVSEDEYMRLEVCEACHEEYVNDIKSTPHWMTGDLRTPASAYQCASCHGNLDEHVENEGGAGVGGMKSFSKAGMMTPAEQNGVCMQCHKESSLLHWAGSGHAAEDVGCVACHRVHKEDLVRSRRSEADVCFSCHTELRAQVNKPYGHPLREQLMTCGDCHNAHGGAGEADLKTFTVNEACYGCHAEKRGPFLWEHPPAAENCLLCHSAHGSIHRGMLERREPLLCQSCHEPAALANNPRGPHAQHSRLGLSYRPPGGTNDLGPGGPGGRGISRLVMGQGCGNCHGHVHGSNHPAGATLMR